MADAAVAHGPLTPAEEDEAVRSHYAAAEQGRTFSANMFAFLLHRP